MMIVPLAFVRVRLPVVAVVVSTMSAPMRGKLAANVGLCQGKIKEMCGNKC